MRRLAKPAALVFGLALVVSLLVHLYAYVSLDELAKLFREQRREAAETSEIELEITDEAEPTEPEDDESEPHEGDVVASADRTRDETDERDQPPREEPRHEDTPPTPEPERPVVHETVPVTPEVERHPPPEAMNKQAVQQRSHDPSAEAPPDARFVARENNVVEEETVAQLRNFSRDDEEQEAGQPSDSEVADTGNAEEEDVADAREMEGSDARTPTEAEANANRPREADVTPPPNVRARGDTAREGAAEEESGPSRADSRPGNQGGARASGGGTRQRLVEVNDGNGTFVVSLPEPAGEGEGADGGRMVAGAGLGERGAGARAGREGRGRVGERGMGRGMGVDGRDLRVSWTAFEETYGEEQLRDEREAWLARATVAADGLEPRARLARVPRRDRELRPERAAGKPDRAERRRVALRRVPRGGAPAHPSRVRVPVPRRAPRGRDLAVLGPDARDRPRDHPEPRRNRAPRRRREAERLSPVRPRRLHGRHARPAVPRGAVVDPER